jgi:transposase-like protein
VADVHNGICRFVFKMRLFALHDCVRWYITYRLSYRDLEGMMGELGVMVAHSTILRWVTGYVPEYEKRCNRFSTTALRRHKRSFARRLSRISMDGHAR